MTAKEHTLAMLGHYIQDIAYDRVDPGIVLLHEHGCATWGGMVPANVIGRLKAEIVRMETFNVPYPPSR
jgi:hypothetical protein